VRQLETRLTPSLSTVASFTAPAGAGPIAGLAMDGGGNLYGTTTSGGAFGDGTIFELVQGSGSPNALASFNGGNGSSPHASLILDSAGNLYGTAEFGGASGDGTVFELTRGSSTITTIASFDGTDGANPYAPLLMDSSANLYGTVLHGGASGDGTVFEVAAGSGTITALASFNGTDGANPYGPLVMDGAANIYGATYGGGASGAGTVFELTHGSGTITRLASFKGSDGAHPTGGLVMDGGGNLYGTTTQGGPGWNPNAGKYGNGTVFEVAARTKAITMLAALDGTDGSLPQAGLVIDGKGNLYGAASQGGQTASGTVFELARASGKITALASFNGTNGADPYGALMLDTSGNLYGSTYYGGSGDGAVFELAAGSQTITRLAAFVTDGQSPLAGLVMDAQGNLYGTTAAGGASNVGTVFEVAAGSNAITTLASFDGINGDYPHGGLVLDGSGNLYGTTYDGGASNDGTVFELAAGSGTITALASFGGTDGAKPAAGLVMDSAGNLYGTTSAGGASGRGAVFEVAQGSGTITTLASFIGGDGAEPLAPLVLDSAGNLYGTAEVGGASGVGTVFEVAHGNRTIAVLASFALTGGGAQRPEAGLVRDNRGNLYGTTAYGGASGDGAIFEVAAGSRTITTLASLNGTLGARPLAGLVMDANGNLYGTTSAGGTSQNGTVFELAAGSATITTLAFLNGTEGAHPDGGLVVDGSGNLYGTTHDGGAGYGTVFELPGVALADQWTGANSAVDTNWSDGANWSTGSPPAPGQTVVFTKNFSVQGFTCTVDAPSRVIGVLKIDSTWGGTITVNTTLSVVGNFTLASGTFAVGSVGTHVHIGGSASRWSGGQIVVGLGFDNSGTLTADTTAGDLVFSGGALSNTGTIIEAGSNGLVLENNATFTNAAGATFDLADNGSVSQSGGGTFTNAGTLEKTGGTGTSTIATTSLSNTGTVDVASGTLAVAATVAQVSGKTLTGGSWTVSGSSTVTAALDITSAGSLTTLGAGATVTLNGLNTSFTTLGGLTTIAAGANFSLLDGQSFTTAGALTNKGSLTLSPGSVLTVSGSVTQTSAGTLNTELGGTATSSGLGQLVSTTGTVTLGGNLDVASTGVVPAVGSALELVDNEGNAAIKGHFAHRAQGSTFKVVLGWTTMTFKITYTGTDTDDMMNVIITRTA
jgi:uncharacterized repeat protein (TIGR03803 family)